MTLLAVAALSARMMAEAAAQDGFDVVALDLFGDVDTCEASSRWFPIGNASEMRIDAARTLNALRVLAQRSDVAGWVAGSGFEGQHQLLTQGAALLPLIGCSPATVAAVRDPVRFFGFLASRDIAHPPMRTQWPDGPADRTGWLLKNATGCGGWHIRRATPSEDLPAGHYLQREWPGTPMSATFVANGRDAVVIGINEQIVRPFGERPFVFCGVIGPVPLPPPAARRVDHAVAALTAEFQLRGLCSLDFLLEGEQVAVLEVNPRPPASMGLYAPQRLMAAHCRACLQGELPHPPSAGSPAATVRGHEIVFARRPLVLDDHASMHLTAWPGTHDLPCAGARFEPGDPLCSLSASGSSAAQVRALLESGQAALLKSLETPP